MTRRGFRCTAAFKSWLMAPMFRRRRGTTIGFVTLIILSGLWFVLCYSVESFDYVDSAGGAHAFYTAGIVGAYYHGGLAMFGLALVTAAMTLRFRIPHLFGMVPAIAAVTTAVLTTMVYAQWGSGDAVVGALPGVVFIFCSSLRSLRGDRDASSRDALLSHHTLLGIWLLMVFVAGLIVNSYAQLLRNGHPSLEFSDDMVKLICSAVILAAVVGIAW